MLLFATLGLVITFGGIFLLILSDHKNDKNFSFILIIIGVLLFCFGTFSNTKENTKQLPKVIFLDHKTDYQLICGNDTLILMDSNIVISKIPYSDTSDIWKVIINDNR